MYITHYIYLIYNLKAILKNAISPYDTLKDFLGDNIDNIGVKLELT